MVTTYLLLLLPLTYLCTGSTDMGTSVLYAATGSAVLFPGVKMDEKTLYDLRKGEDTLVLTFHGSYNVRPPFTGRVTFFPHNGTTFWKEVRKEDSGSYQHVVNMSVVEEIHLQVIDGVSEPVLWENTVPGDDGQCLHYFSCRARGDGPLTMAILRNKVEIIRNYSTTLLLAIGDPAAEGTYSCRVANPVSDAVSPEIKVHLIVTPLQIGIIQLILGLVSLWLILRIPLWIRIITKMKKGEQAPTEGASVHAIEVTEMIIGLVQDLYMVFPSFLDGALFPIYLSVSMGFATCRICWYIHNHHGDFCGDPAEWKSLFFRTVTTISSVVTLSLFLIMAHDVDNRLSESSCNLMNKYVIPSLYGMTSLTLLCEVFSFVVITYMNTSDFKRKRERESSSRHSDSQEGQTIMNAAPGENNRELSSLTNEEEEQPGSTPAPDDHSSKLEYLDPNARIPNGNQGEEDQVSSSVASMEESLEEPRARKSYRRTAQMPEPKDSKDPEDKDG